MLLRLVVAQLQGGVAEVPQHVAVVDLLADVQRRVQRSAAADQLPSATWVIATSMCRRHRVRGGSPAVAAAKRSLGRQRRAAVGAEGAHDGRSDADLQGPDRVDTGGPRARPRRRSGGLRQPSRG